MDFVKVVFASVERIIYLKISVGQFKSQSAKNLFVFVQQIDLLTDRFIKVVMHVEF